jgi:putative ABC transport system permease protein
MAYPAAYVPVTAPIAWAAMPPQQARLFGGESSTDVVIIGATHLPPSELLAAEGAASHLGSSLYVELGFRASLGWVVVVLVGSDILLVVAVTLAMTALIGADSRDEMAVLSALGAPPRGRRRLATAQAGLIAGLGSVLGTATGMLAGAMLARYWGILGSFGFSFLTDPGAGWGGGQFDFDAHVPWQVVLLVLGAAAASLVTAAFTPRRLPVERRDARR